MHFYHASTLPDLFDCAVNPKHDSKSNRCLHTINFVYDEPDDSISADLTGKIVDTPVAAISDDIDIPNAQHQCPDFKDIIEYLETGTLPENDVAARRIVLDSEQYTLIDNTLLCMP